MAEYDDVEQGNMHPALSEFQDMVTSPAASEYAQEAAIIVNDFVQRKELADANQAAGENFENDLGTVRTNLIGMVGDDPSTLPLAMDLVRPTLGAMFGTIPGLDEEQFAAHYEAVSGELERDIVRSAVHKTASLDDKAAYGILDNLGGMLPEEEREGLRGYIDTQAKARLIDADAQADMQAQEQERRHDRTAWNYLAAMTDPNNGAVKFPPDWAQRVVGDNTLTPPAKAQLLNTFGTIRENGDAPRTNPFLASEIVTQLAGDNPPSMPGVLSHAGTGLRLADALTLSGINNDSGRATALANIISTAENTLARPENGRAGSEAFGKFVNWLLPAVRNGAVLDPNAEGYVLGGNRLQAFAPTTEQEVSLMPRPAARRSLADIFSGGIAKAEDLAEGLAQTLAGGGTAGNKPIPRPPLPAPRASADQRRVRTPTNNLNVRG